MLTNKRVASVFEQLVKKADGQQESSVFQLLNEPAKKRYRELEAACASIGSPRLKMAP